MSGSSSSEGSAPKSGFQHAANFVERALSFRPKAAAVDTTASTQLHGKMRSLAPLTPKDLADSRAFPVITDTKLLALLPGDELQDARKCIRTAIEEMHLNYDLDTKLLGERSETNRGNRLIALLLSRLSIEDHSSDESGMDRALLGESTGNDIAASATSGSIGRNSKAMKRTTFETHDLLKAIDNRDMETILAIRDANFDLLLDLSQGGSVKNASSSANTGGNTLNTPLGYAISLGKDWQGISIILVGALSKFVNNLPEDEDEYQAQCTDAGSGPMTKSRKPKKLQLDPVTMQRLRKVRVNLKLAIDHSIFQDQNSLLASYLQVLVMSEGSAFLLNAIEAIEHCLLSKLGDPITQARSQVLQFVTESLKHKQDKIAAVKDYISNAQSDLLLMSLWNVVKLPKSALAEASSLPSSDIEDLANPLPLYFFARDDRVTTHFVERVDKVKHFDQTHRKHTALLNLASRLAEALQQGARRPNSNERLEIVKAQFARQ